MCYKKSKRSKKQKNDFIKSVNIFCYKYSKDELLNIQTEAYYRAMKRIEQEKEQEIEEKKRESDAIKKEKWYINLLFFLNVLFWPFKIHKRFKVNERVYDNLLVFVVSFILMIVGFLAWLSGILIIGYMVWSAIVMKPTGNLSILLLSIWGTFVGCVLIVSGNEFSKEADSSKIYAYSASIFALASCIVGIIALMK